MHFQATKIKIKAKQKRRKQIWNFLAFSCVSPHLLVNSSFFSFSFRFLSLSSKNLDKNYLNVVQMCTDFLIVFHCMCSMFGQMRLIIGLLLIFFLFLLPVYVWHVEIASNHWATNWKDIFWVSEHTILVFFSRTVCVSLPEIGIVVVAFCEHSLYLSPFRREFQIVYTESTSCSSSLITQSKTMEREKRSLLYAYFDQKKYIYFAYLSQQLMWNVFYVYACMIPVYCAVLSSVYSSWQQNFFFLCAKIRFIKWKFLLWIGYSIVKSMTLVGFAVCVNRRHSYFCRHFYLNYVTWIETNVNKLKSDSFKWNYLYF